MERQERIGYSMMGAALLLVLAGSVGFTVEGTTSIDVVTTGGKPFLQTKHFLNTRWAPLLRLI